MKKNLFVLLVLVSLFVIFSCAGVAELRGRGKPATDASIPMSPESKVYKAPQAKVVSAVKSCLDKEGIMFEISQGDGKTVRITTESITVQQVSLMRSMMGGSSYYAREIIDVEPNGRVTFRARFTKSFSDRGIKTENLKYPEKENELRTKFFSALDKEI